MTTHDPDRPWLRTGVPLASLTTIGLGGPARALAACTTTDALRAALAYGAERRLPVQVLGGGSNIIFSDAGYGGLVVRVEIPGLAFAEEGDHVLVTAGAGELWDPMVARCVAMGTAGIECLSGIPGSVGATPVQNVGAYGQEVAETIAQVRALDRSSGRELLFQADDCGFGYRQSRFKGADAGRFIITEVTFRLRRDGTPSVRYAELQRALDARTAAGARKQGPEALQEVREAVISLRRRKSMVIDPADPCSRSVGSFFMNPVLTQPEFERLTTRWQQQSTEPVPSFPAGAEVKVPAAWLVEHAGFRKGERRGGAGISKNHALALVNYGGSTRELLGLAEEIQQRVLTTFGIALEREPVVVPEEAAA